MLTTRQLKYNRTYSNTNWKSKFNVVFKDNEGVLVRFTTGHHLFVHHNDPYNASFTEVKKAKKAYLRMITNGVNVWGSVSTHEAYRGKGQVLSQFEVTVSGHLTTAPRKADKDELDSFSNWPIPEI